MPRESGMTPSYGLCPNRSDVVTGSPAFAGDDTAKCLFDVIRQCPHIGRVQSLQELSHPVRVGMAGYVCCRDGVQKNPDSDDKRRYVHGGFGPGLAVAVFACHGTLQIETLRADT